MFEWGVICTLYVLGCILSNEAMWLALEKIGLENIKPMDPIDHLVKWLMIIFWPIAVLDLIFGKLKYWMTNKN